MIAVVYLRKMIGEVNNVVDQVPMGGDLEVWDGPVVDRQSALVTVKIEQAIVARILLKFLGLGQHTSDLVKKLV